MCYTAEGVALVLVWCHGHDFVFYLIGPSIMSKVKAVSEIAATATAVAKCVANDVLNFNGDAELLTVAVTANVKSY